MVTRSSLISRRTVQKFRQAAISATGSLKIKLLLLFCCFIFTLTLLASCTPSFFGWSQQSVPSIDRSYRKGYTLLINTWKRYDLLKQSISHYTSCPGLDSIHIVWSEPDPPSDPLVKFLNHAVKSNSKDGRHIELTFDINKEDSLNNRFKELKNPITDAVFSIDDDIIFPCSSVEFAFSVWQSAPDTMKENRYPYIYGGWWAVWWSGTYSMILSKASFFHTKYLRMYTNEMPSSLLEYVRRNRNCEDIAMSFLVANATGAPPIWAKGKIYEIGSTGISSLGGHSNKRTECVNRFVSEFGRMTLVPTTVKAIDSRHTWFW
ncbi:glycosylinositol phosphorylceramide mannosyl transferase 1-like isoform X2 [Bidens hawaiensis]|uniref:glycosylinositol phosphorylceramide mannosyl transferase 1-like isoform X2 n=1 Tax=Bidens hawaiensis TaxID=980011 RepID=UPI004049EC4F